ncbi:MAG: hypothetical protein P0S95_01115 [Rhabdochlamydiaceae bacterium]|nr:hypothetical protein [Candidatus Amphrikana amoebophyrae]
MAISAIRNWCNDRSAQLDHAYEAARTSHKERNYAPLYGIAFDEDSSVDVSDPTTGRAKKIHDKAKITANVESAFPQETVKVKAKLVRGRLQIQSRNANVFLTGEWGHIETFSFAANHDDITRFDEDGNVDQAATDAEYEKASTVRCLKKGITKAAENTLNGGAAGFDATQKLFRYLAQQIVRGGYNEVGMSQHLRSVLAGATRVIGVAMAAIVGILATIGSGVKSFVINPLMAVVIKPIAIGFLHLLNVILPHLGFPDFKIPNLPPLPNLLKPFTVFLSSLMYVSMIPAAIIGVATWLAVDIGLIGIGRTIALTVGFATANEQLSLIKPLSREIEELGVALSHDDLSRYEKASIRKKRSDLKLKREALENRAGVVGYFKDVVFNASMSNKSLGLNFVKWVWNKNKDLQRLPKTKLVEGKQVSDRLDIVTRFYNPTIKQDAAKATAFREALTSAAETRAERGSACDSLLGRSSRLSLSSHDGAGFGGDGGSSASSTTGTLSPRSPSLSDDGSGFGSGRGGDASRRVTVLDTPRSVASEDDIEDELFAHSPRSARHG